MDQYSSKDESEIRAFFEGRSVLVTGASGYLGSVLLEHLLRLCPGIAEIFILLRGKKERTPVERREQIFNKQIFWKIKKETPEALQKVHAVSGELVQDNAGVSPEDLEKLQKNVSVVFHCAASISFYKDIRFMLKNNVLGTYNIISLCKKLPNIAAFVCSSSAYSNCHLEVIKEEIFHIPVPLDKIIEAARTDDEIFIKTLEKDHGRKWFNTYVFSKSIAENVVVQETSDTPTAIVRPSIICHQWKGSLPGYIEPGTFFSDVVYAIVTGITQVILMDENKRADTVPPDIVANTLITTAWSIAIKRVQSPLVLNCISSNSVSLTWGQFFDDLLSNPYSVFCPNTFRTPKLTFAHSLPQYHLLTFFYHYVVGYAMDLFALCVGAKPRYTNIYKIIDQGLRSSRRFTLSEFCFESANFDKLKCLLNKKDNEIFSTDLTGFNFRYIAEHCRVNEAFRYKSDDVDMKLKQVALAERLAMVTELYKCFLMFILFTCVWFLSKLVFHIFRS